MARGKRSEFDPRRQVGRNVALSYEGKGWYEPGGLGHGFGHTGSRYGDPWFNPETRMRAGITRRENEYPQEYSDG